RADVIRFVAWNSIPSGQVIDVVRDGQGHTLSCYPNAFGWARWPERTRRPGPRRGVVGRGLRSASLLQILRQSPKIVRALSPSPVGTSERGLNGSTTQTPISRLPDDFERRQHRLGAGHRADLNGVGHEMEPEAERFGAL